MNELHLFAGVGGGILGGILCGHTCVGAVEIEPYCRKVLLQRQRDGILPKFPIWDDVTTFDGKPWQGRVGAIKGGFPCQDISAAGSGEGLNGARSGLWRQFARIISEVLPRFVLVENSPMLTSRGLGVILGDLAGMGYNAKWGVISAFDAGLDHGRRRIWILAYTHGERIEGLGQGTRSFCLGATRGVGKRREDSQAHMRHVAAAPYERGPDWPQPLLRGAKDGFPNWMDRIKCIGNGQVPRVEALAWETLRP